MRAVALAIPRRVWYNSFEVIEVRVFYPGKEKFEFVLGKPNLTVTRNFAKCKSDLRKLGVPYRNCFRGGRRIVFRGKLPGYDEELLITIWSFLNKVSHIEFDRTDEYRYAIKYDIYRSFREFSSALQNLYGEPQIVKPLDAYGEIREEWETPYHIYHYIFERFLLSEHLIISF